ncbi:MAG: hypothetical protein P1V97_35800, partial [Planctomycetota bacterium]|nr:hypothetical protein [Planctomycetota bacterium]
MMTSLFSNPWSGKSSQSLGTSLHRIVPGSFIPTIYRHAGVLWGDSADDAVQILDGVFDPEAMRLSLTLKHGEEPPKNIEIVVPAGTATALLSSVEQSMAKLRLLDSLGDSERALINQWSRCFGSLPLAEFQIICECYEDIVAAYSTSPEAEKRLVQHSAQARAGTLRDTFLRLALGERPSCRPVFARSLTLLGLSLGDYGLAEQGYAAMKQSGSGATPLLRARVALELAQARFLREHLSGYSALIKQAYELTPEDPVVIRQRGTAQLVLKEWAAAVETWTALVAQSPKDIHYRYGLGQAYEGLEESEKALETYESLVGDLSGLELTEDRRDLLVTVLGHVSGLQIHLGRHDDLAETARHYAPIFSREPKLINVLVSSLFMIYKYEEGGRLLDASLALDPDNPLAHILKCRSLLALGNAPAAIESARKAVALDDNQPLWKVALAEALVEGNEHKEGSLLFGKLAKEAGGMVPSGTYMVLVAGKHEADGEFEKAEKSYRAAVGTYSESHFTRSEYGAFLISRERYADAVD